VRFCSSEDPALIERARGLQSELLHRRGVTLPDGKRLLITSLGTGAPDAK
jgi:hypothetical protein